jgi:hypothetical protein
MRYLAIAHFRALTLIRSTAPFYVVAMLPALIGAIYESQPEPFFRAEAEVILPRNATAAVAAWVIHALILFFASLASGTARRHMDLQTAERADLIDTAPVSLENHYWGEVLGTFLATIVIHICCLPLLAVVAALSPLPTSFFAAIEAVIVALILLAAAGAAWQRRAAPSKFSGTRGPRMALLFLVLLLMTFRHTTGRWEAFRDSALAFFLHASTRSWAAVVEAIDNPTLLVSTLLLVYLAYLVYFYVAGTRTPSWEKEP